MQNNYPIYERFCQINVTNTCGSEAHTKECPKLNNNKKKRKHLEHDDGEEKIGKFMINKLKEK